MSNLLFHNRLYNRYSLITVISIFAVLVLSWFFVSGLGEVLFMDYSAPDLGGRDHAEVRAEMLPIFLQQIMSWEVLLISSMAYIVSFLPLFLIFPTITFSKELKSYFVFGRHRFKSYSKSLLGSVVKHSFIAAFISMSAFILFYAIIGLFVTAQQDWMTMFGSFLPAGFYSSYPLLFFIFMFLTIYFVIAFIFASISCGVMMFVENAYYAIFGITVAYYINLHVAVYLDRLLSASFGRDIEFFWLGSTVIAFNTFRTTSQVFIPLIPLSLIAIAIVYFGIKKQTRKVSV